VSSPDAAPADSASAAIVAAIADTTCSVGSPRTIARITIASEAERGEDGMRRRRG
jgi:hypothetical protein